MGLRELQDKQQAVSWQVDDTRNLTTPGVVVGAPLAVTNALQWWDFTQGGNGIVPAQSPTFWNSGLVDALVTVDGVIFSEVSAGDALTWRGPIFTLGIKVALGATTIDPPICGIY